jgi:cytochrome bd-type quinol oxidase subunit 2
MMSYRSYTMTRIVLTGFVAVHLVAVIWHGAAHKELAIALSPAQNLFICSVIVLAPLVAAGLLWTRYVRLALWIFLVAMCGSLLFGIYYHYVCISPDNVRHLPAGSAASHERFTLSAAIVALIELASVVCAAFVVGRRMRRV